MDLEQFLGTSKLPRREHTANDVKQQPKPNVKRTEKFNYVQPCMYGLSNLSREIQYQITCIAQATTHLLDRKFEKAVHLDVAKRNARKRSQVKVNDQRGPKLAWKTTHDYKHNTLQRHRSPSNNEKVVIKNPLEDDEIAERELKNLYRRICLEQVHAHLDSAALDSKPLKKSKRGNSKVKPKKCGRNKLERKNGFNRMSCPDYLFQNVQCYDDLNNLGCNTKKYGNKRIDRKSRFDKINDQDLQCYDNLNKLKGNTNKCTKNRIEMKSGFDRLSCADERFHTLKSYVDLNDFGLNREQLQKDQNLASNKLKKLSKNKGERKSEFDRLNCADGMYQDLKSYIDLDDKDSNIKKDSNHRTEKKNGFDANEIFLDTQSYADLNDFSNSEVQHKIYQDISATNKIVQSQKKPSKKSSIPHKGIDYSEYNFDDKEYQKSWLKQVNSKVERNTSKMKDNKVDSIDCGIKCLSDQRVQNLMQDSKCKGDFFNVNVSKKQLRKKVSHKKVRAIKRSSSGLLHIPKIFYRNPITLRSSTSTI